MFNEKTKAGIINQLGTVAGVKPSETSVALITAVTEKVQEVGIADVTLSDIVAVEVDGKSLTDNQSAKVMAAIEFHKAVVVSTASTREKKPTKLEEFIADNPVEVRDDIAIEVAERRINAEGTRPRAWRSIREELGLRNEEFHQLIRKSQGWHNAVCERIADLLDQEGGWAYNGKLETLTGIEGFTMDMVDSYLEELKAEATAKAEADAEGKSEQDDSSDSKESTEEEGPTEEELAAIEAEQDAE